MLKEMINTGLGVAATLKEKVENEIELKDGKNIFESLEGKGKDERSKIKDELKSIIKDIVDDLGLATKDDIVKLKEELSKEKN